MEWGIISQHKRQSAATEPGNDDVLPGSSAPVDTEYGSGFGISPKSSRKFKTLAVQSRPLFVWEADEEVAIWVCRSKYLEVWRNIGEEEERGGREIGGRG